MGLHTKIRQKLIFFVREADHVLFVACFDKISDHFTVQGKYLAHIRRVYPDISERLMGVTACALYIAGRAGEDAPAALLSLKRIGEAEDSLRLEFSGSPPTQTSVGWSGLGKMLPALSGPVAEGVLRQARRQALLDTDGRAPLLCFAEKTEYKDIISSAETLAALDALLEQGDYKGVCMRFAPLRNAKANPAVWDNPDVLYRLGRACSKLSTTLLIKAGETKKLREAAQYRAYAVAFFKARRGAGTGQRPVRDRAGVPALLQRA